MMISANQNKESTIDDLERNHHSEWLNGLTILKEFDTSDDINLFNACSLSFHQRDAFACSSPQDSTKCYLNSVPGCTESINPKEIRRGRGRPRKYHDSNSKLTDDCLDKVVLNSKTTSSTFNCMCKICSKRHFNESRVQNSNCCYGNDVVIDELTGSTSECSSDSNCDYTKLPLIGTKHLLYQWDDFSDGTSVPPHTFDVSFIKTNLVEDEVEGANASSSELNNGVYGSLITNNSDSTESSNHCSLDSDFYSTYTQFLDSTDSVIDWDDFHNFELKHEICSVYNSCNDKDYSEKITAPITLHLAEPEDSIRCQAPIVTTNNTTTTTTTTTVTSTTTATGRKKANDRARSILMGWLNDNKGSSSTTFQLCYNEI